jgi:hypothetical protein
LCGSLVAIVLVPAAADSDASLAQHVPADVGLFVELRNGSDLLIPLTAPEAWLTVAELAGQPARIEETRDWRIRVQQTVRMTPIDAIRRLFSQRVAFAGDALRRSQDAVVLCRPGDPPRRLMRGWQARPFPTSGRTSVYRLPNNVGLAVQDRLMVFGDDGTSGMFRDLLTLLEGDLERPLAEDPVFRALLQRVPEDPDGVLFARLSRGAPASAPADSRPAMFELPGPLRGSSNVLLALHRDDELLHFSAVGDAQNATATHDGSLVELVERLPERTLLAWAGHVNYSELTRAIDSLPDRNVIRIAYRVHQRTGGMQQLIDALDSSACIAIGTVDPPSRRVTAPPVPAVAVMVRTRDSSRVVREWSTLFHATLSLYKLLTLKIGGPPAPIELDTVQVGNAVAERLNVSQVFGVDLANTPLGEFHLCWALDRDALIIASHIDWLRQIVAARNGDAARLAPVLELAGRSASTQSDCVLVAQAGPVGDLGLLWLKYLEDTLPAVLNQDWWRAHQPGGRKPRLGIQVTAAEAERRLRVVSVAAGSPAEDIIQPGDEIIGCNHRRFATSQPVQELRQGLVRRRDARWIDLYVERDRVVRVRRIPLPFVDPVQVLRRVCSVGTLVQRLVYMEEVPEAAGPRGSLTLELRQGAPPLFAFELTPRPPTPDSEHLSN